jgi:hypothetical protein
MGEHDIWFDLIPGVKDAKHALAHAMGTTWLNGEDGETGDVSLECHLVLDGAAGSQRMLRAVINIYHAGFVGFQLSAL